MRLEGDALEYCERTVAHHTDLAWIRLYIARWLKAPVQHQDGTLEQPTRGTSAC
jgi:RNA-directed DNA polymerase